MSEETPAAGGPTKIVSDIIQKHGIGAGLAVFVASARSIMSLWIKRLASKSKKAFWFAGGIGTPSPAMKRF
jgi:hypothetical protein